MSVVLRYTDCVVVRLKSKDTMSVAERSLAEPTFLATSLDGTQDEMGFHHGFLQ